jgi:hypothetical protein
MKKILAVALVLFLFSAPNVFAQGEPCTADFNCSQTVDADDVTEFLNQFGRSPFNDPCPDCYDSPCPCTGPQTLPDLAVLSIVTNPVNPDPGELVSIEVTVINQGASDAGEFWIDWYHHRDIPPTPAQVGDRDDRVFSLAPNATHTMSASYTYSTAGAYNMYAQVDTDQEIMESNEDNNIYGPQGICVAHPAPVEKTGQTTSYRTGDDGEYEKGVSWPNPRFTDNLDGTITDNLTGLIWLKDANCFGEPTWLGALSDSNGLADGSCGLTDGSSAGDWRLPNIKELLSLIDYGNVDPALPTGHPFTNVQSEWYWSSTTVNTLIGWAWDVDMFNGNSSQAPKNQPSSNEFVWPVRGGQ